MANNPIYILQKNIKKYRKAKGLNQIQLSMKVEMSKDFLSEIERGIGTPSLKRLVKISEVLDVELYKFFIEE